MAKKETTELVAIISLDVEDMRTGLELEKDTARAQARLQALHDAEQSYHNVMAAKYGVDLSAYEFVDWITGWRVKGG